MNVWPDLPGLPVVPRAPGDFRSGPGAPSGIVSGEIEGADVTRSVADDEEESPEILLRDFVLTELRGARFGRGVRCPRCGHRRTHRWGSFSGRRRYRCLGCGRTFSDLTATPAAYSKKLPLWVPYAECMAEGLSVRRAARTVGIHPCTAFRWRHALLRPLRARDRETLRGWIELGAMRFAYSEKGRRGVSGRLARRTRAPFRWHINDDAVNVLVVCDRRGHVVSTIAWRGTRRCELAELEKALRHRIEGLPVVVAAQGRFGPAARFARLRRGSFHDARFPARGATDDLVHLLTVRAYTRRFGIWHARFRGVATRYLPHYLAWHRSVDRAVRLGVRAAVLRWEVADRFG